MCAWGPTFAFRVFDFSRELVGPTRAHTQRARLSGSIPRGGTADIIFLFWSNHPQGGASKGSIYARAAPCVVWFGKKIYKKDQRTACGDRTHDQRIKSPTLCLTELRRRRYGGQANRSWFICVSRNHERERRKNGITNTQLNKKRIARRGFALIKVTRSKLWNSQFFLRAHQSMSPSKRKKKSRGGKKETCDFVTFALCDFSVHIPHEKKNRRKHLPYLLPFLQRSAPPSQTTWRGAGPASGEAAEAKFSTWPR